MADVFISYAREDYAVARTFAAALEQAGLSVWWDPDIQPGQRFADVIDDALARTGCVLALWSPSAVASDWVLEEAADGRDRGILVPVFIEDVQPPRGFRRIHAADLTEWRGDRGAPEFAHLERSVRALLDEHPGADRATPPIAPPVGDAARRLGRSPRRPVMGGGVGEALRAAKRLLGFDRGAVRAPSVRTVSLVAADLTGSTSVSEGDPAVYVRFLEAYLDAVRRVADSTGATVEVVATDSVLLHWNAAEPQPDHADRAIGAVLLLHQTIVELERDLRSELASRLDIAVRCGVHTGRILVATVRGHRGPVSLIGDEVDLAWRLEGVCKTYGTLNLCSEATFEEAHFERYRTRPIDDLAWIGKALPVKVFEVMGLRGDPLSGDAEAALTAYYQGMALYRNREWEQALHCFEDATRRLPTDGPSRVYVERCRQNIADPPPIDWDFVVRRTGAA